MHNKQFAPMFIYSILVVILFFSVVRVFAETVKLDKTVITSKRLMFDYKRSIAIFNEDVLVVDPQINIKSDKLTVFFDSTNDVKSVTAEGSVYIWYKDKIATCKKAIYRVKIGNVLLVGNAKLSWKKDSVSGNEINLWLNKNQVTCKPGRLIVFTKKPESNLAVKKKNK